LQIYNIPFYFAPFSTIFFPQFFILGDFAGMLGVIVLIFR